MGIATLCLDLNILALDLGALCMLSDVRLQQAIMPCSSTCMRTLPQALAMPKQCASHATHVHRQLPVSCLTACLGKVGASQLARGIMLACAPRIVPDHNLRGVL